MDFLFNKSNVMLEILWSNILHCIKTGIKKKAALMSHTTAGNKVPKTTEKEASHQPPNEFIHQMNHFTMGIPHVQTNH